jgi:coenzyme F420-0:L-glutamate ligase/coenzyme F420-1:gamma-L-glutamate ligase
MKEKIEILSLKGFPMVKAGDDLADMILASLTYNNFKLENGDVLVLAQKIVSKAEGRMVSFSEVQPSKEAEELAEACDKDPRLVELVLSESEQVLKCVPGVIIVRHKLGFVMANAGIDQSNIEGNAVEGEVALLLPINPDKSASELKHTIDKALNVKINVVINDSFGRPFREGTAGVCIGSAGFAPLDIKTGSTDLFGRELLHTEVAVADEIAAAASLIMGQASEGRPLVIIRGLELGRAEQTAQDLVRPLNKDLFQ